MANIVGFFLNSLNTIWSALISDPIKSIGALAAIISASAAIGTLIISLRKDATKVKVVVKRAKNGSLILQHPQEEFLIFEVYNQGTTPVVINEIGITVFRGLWRKKQLINLVDLPHADVKIGNQSGAIGTLEYVGLPGTVTTKSQGVFLLQYSGMKAASLNYQKQQISPESLEFVGSERLTKTCQEFQKLQDEQGKNIQIIPYVLTGSGERFVGRKAYVKLGILGDAVV